LRAPEAHPEHRPPWSVRTQAWDWGRAAQTRSGNAKGTRCLRRPCASPAPPGVGNRNGHACGHAAAPPLIWAVALMPGTQVAPCKPPTICVRSRRARTCYKIKYGTLSRLISPMPVAASTLTGRRRPDTRGAMCFEAGARRESIHATPPRRAPRVRMQRRCAAVQKICPAGGSALGVWLAICMGNATYTVQNGIIKQLMHIKRVRRHQLPHAGRCLNPVGEAAPRQWGHQCASRWAPSSGLTTTSRALVGQRR
jgi:hypothetical protein